MQKTIYQLEKECRSLGLTLPQSRYTGRGGKPAKRDYVSILGEYYLKQTYGSLENIPWGMKARLEMRSPMLASLLSNCSEEEQKEIFSSAKWIFQRKVDGVRMNFFFDGEGGFEAYSRNISVQDFLPVPYHSKIQMPELPEIFKGRQFSIDCEVQCENPNVDTTNKIGGGGVVTETVLQATAALLSINDSESLALQVSNPLKFYAFDLMHWNGKPLFNKSYGERHHALVKVVTQLQKAGFPIHTLPWLESDNKVALLQEMWDAGEEGVIAKRLDSEYTPDETRSRVRWVKIKRSMKGMLNSSSLGDSIDAYVVGFSPGKSGSGWENLVGSLDLALMVVKPNGDEDEHVIARVSNIPLEERKKMTVIEDGEVKLRPEYFGRVYEIDGQDVSSRALRFTHAHIVRERPDRSAFECIMMEDDLRKQIL